MVILVIEHVSASMRGELSRWMIEPRAGLFIGNISAMVRDKLWDYIIKKSPGAGVIMIHNAKNEQRFEVRSHGDTTRKIIDFEGVFLVQHIKR